MLRSLIVALHLLLVPVLAQETPPASASPAAQQESPASTPIYPNPSCPIMGKPVSKKLFAETEFGRIYVCCKSCVKDILADVPAAYRTAYPTDTKIENTICPVSGGKIRKDSPAVVLQGVSFFVRDAGDVEKARENSQIVLAKLHDPTLVDLENGTCPVSGEPVAKNAFVVIEGTIVRLSSAKLLEEVSKDPAMILKKAREIRASEDAAKASAKTPGDAAKP